MRRCHLIKTLFLRILRRPEQHYGKQKNFFKFRSCINVFSKNFQARKSFERSWAILQHVESTEWRIKKSPSWWYKLRMLTQKTDLWHLCRMFASDGECTKRKFTYLVLILKVDTCCSLHASVGPRIRSFINVFVKIANIWQVLMLCRNMFSKTNFFTVNNASIKGYGVNKAAFLCKWGQFII